MSSWQAHPTAIVESADIGPNTRVWAFCHVLAGAVIGENCNIGDYCYIEGGASIGNDVVLKNHVAVWRGVAIGNRVFVGPHVAFTNDRVPRAKAFRDDYDKTTIEEGASLGANATLLCPIVVGRYAMIGAGAVVTNDVPDFGLVVGNPARLRGYVCRCGRGLQFAGDAAACQCGVSFRKDGRRVEETL